MCITSAWSIHMGGYTLTFISCDLWCFTLRKVDETIPTALFFPFKIDLDMVWGYLFILRPFKQDGWEGKQGTYEYSLKEKCCHPSLRKKMIVKTNPTKSLFSRRHLLQNLNKWQTCCRGSNDGYLKRYTIIKIFVTFDILAILFWEGLAEQPEKTRHHEEKKTCK